VLRALPVPLYVCPSRTGSELENKKAYTKTKIDVNVSQGWSYRCANFQLNDRGYG